jgi:hypothetical protein
MAKTLSPLRELSFFVNVPKLIICFSLILLYSISFSCICICVVYLLVFACYIGSLLSVKTLITELSY